MAVRGSFCARTSSGADTPTHVYAHTPLHLQAPSSLASAVPKSKTRMACLGDCCLPMHTWVDPNTTVCSFYCVQPARSARQYSCKLVSHVLPRVCSGLLAPGPLVPNVTSDNKGGAYHSGIRIACPPDRQKTTKSFRHPDPRLLQRFIALASHALRWK